tara:strand:+ start:775 stop:1059 length:285 start_codon:yes stop_codon:yes gene_type:complete
VRAFIEGGNVRVTMSEKEVAQRAVTWPCFGEVGRVSFTFNPTADHCGGPFDLMYWSVPDLIDHYAAEELAWECQAYGAKAWAGVEIGRLAPINM